MTSRERVRRAMAREPADRAPARFNAAPDAQARRLAQVLGVPPGPDWFEALQVRLAIDMRYVDSEIAPGRCEADAEILARAESPADVDRLWPARFRVEHRTFAPAVERVRARDRSGNPPALQARLNSLFGLVRRMRGDTLAFTDLAEGSPLFLRLMDRLEAFNADMIDLAFATFGDRLDLVGLGDELGMQTGLMFSPDAIREHFFPRYGRLFGRVHARGGKVFFHSCGAIAPLIGELIALGVDVLNPIQPLPGMEPEALATAHGGRVCFCGGLDMQRLMPLGTPEEVRAEAVRYCRALAPGYILDLANILHPDIPDANVLALYQAPRV